MVLLSTQMTTNSTRQMGLNSEILIKAGKNE